MPSSDKFYLYGCGNSEELIARFGSASILNYNYFIFFFLLGDSAFDWLIPFYFNLSGLGLSGNRFLRVGLKAGLPEV